MFLVFERTVTPVHFGAKSRLFEFLTHRHFTLIPLVKVVALITQHANTFNPVLAYGFAVVIGPLLGRRQGLEGDRLLRSIA